VPITYESLEAQGLHTYSIALALNEIHALGLGEVKRGRGGNAEFRRPNFIRLTYLPSGESGEIPATHDWKNIKTRDEANEIAKKSRGKNNHKKSFFAPKNRGESHTKKCGRKTPVFTPKNVGHSPDFSHQKIGVFTNTAISHSRPQASEPATASQDGLEPASLEPSTSVAAPIELKLEPSADNGDDMADTKQEQDLTSMIEVLRTFLGNRATSEQWYKQMQSFYGAGWSRRSFKRRVRILKARKWIGVVGKPDIDLERVPEGSLFEATEIAPGASSPLGSDLAHEAADAAAKAAMELLERMRRGKPTAA
jgi:hypothetical protein